MNTKYNKLYFLNVGGYLKHLPEPAEEGEEVIIHENQQAGSRVQQFEDDFFLTLDNPQQYIRVVRKSGKHNIFHKSHFETVEQRKKKKLLESIKRKKWHKKRF